MKSVDKLGTFTNNMYFLSKGYRIHWNCRINKKRNKKKLTDITAHGIFSINYLTVLRFHLLYKAVGVYSLHSMAPYQISKRQNLVRGCVNLIQSIASLEVIVH